MGCACNQQKNLNRHVSLWRLDKIPYGTLYAHDNLPFVFPNADIRTHSKYPESLLTDNSDDTLRALIILSPSFAPDSEEMNSIIRFASFGNQVFISALDFDDTAMDMLHLKWKKYNFPEDSAEISLLDPATNQFEKFTYPGYSLNSYFKSLDTAAAAILGKDRDGNPDFIRIPFPQGGAIFIHLNPFAFTNFFLLHKQNTKYYDESFSYLPSNTRVVEWSDYFRYTTTDEHFSALRFILGNRSLRWAFWLTLLLFGLLFLMESKRKQRPIIEIPPLKNASVDFVKTVGRLYFQQKNNQNLAAKMVAAFLENIRSAYNLSTSVLNEDFVHKLAFRTGKPVGEVQQIVNLIHEVRLKPDLPDRELMDLHFQISQFNKSA